MPVTLTIPNEYGYVLFVAAANSFLSAWHGMLVNGYRKEAKVPYPNAYASSTDAEASQDKYLFNCAQRAHTNYLENLPNFLVTLMMAGVRYPVLSAACGVAYQVGRVMYTRGYLNPAKKGGKGRFVGIWYHVPEMALIVMSGLAGWGILTGN